MQTCIQWCILRVFSFFFLILLTITLAISRTSCVQLHLLIYKLPCELIAICISKIFSKNSSSKLHHRQRRNKTFRKFFSSAKPFFPELTFRECVGYVYPVKNGISTELRWMGVVFMQNLLKMRTSTCYNVVRNKEAYAHEVDS